MNSYNQEDNGLSTGLNTTQEASNINEESSSSGILTVETSKHIIHMKQLHNFVEIHGV